MNEHKKQEWTFLKKKHGDDAYKFVEVKLLDGIWRKIANNDQVCLLEKFNKELRIVPNALLRRKPHTQG